MTLSSIVVRFLFFLDNDNNVVAVFVTFCS